MTTVPAPPPAPRPRGGDRWEHCRAECAAFRAALVVHRLGVATSADVAAALGVPRRRAYDMLYDALRSRHLYHVRRLGAGRFAVAGGQSPDATSGTSVHV